MAGVFGKPVQRLLMIAVPEIDRNHFSIDVAVQGRYPCFPPYGPGVLVRCVEAAGYTADIIDLQFEVLRKASEQAGGAFDFDVWKVPLEAKIEEFRPDVIGLSGMFENCAAEFSAIARHLKCIHPDIPIISGGVYASLMVDKVLNELPEIDFVLFNEAEQTLVHFLDAANGRDAGIGLKGVATLDPASGPVATPAAIPPALDIAPDYKDLPIADYAKYGTIGAYTFLRDAGTPSATAISRRGCRAACTFCSVRTVSGKGVRVRSGQSVVDEIQRLHENYGVRHIMWLDDDLFFDISATIAMFREIADRKLPVTWDASNGVIAAAMTHELLEAAVASGCIGFNIGVESGNAEILRNMNKPGNIRTYLRAANLLTEFPTIFTKGFLLVGYPSETVAALADTVDLAGKMDLDWYPSQIVMPMGGTPVEQMMLQQDQYGETVTKAANGKNPNKAGSFSVGVTGSVRQRELAEKKKAAPFFNPFSETPDYIPRRDQMVDVWFTVDYLINYRPIIAETRPHKLRKKKAMLDELVQRMGTEHPLAALFLGICERKLGHPELAERRHEIVSRGLAASEYWRMRFDALGINDSCTEYFAGQTGQPGPKPDRPSYSRGIL
ncbi:MAG: radical SAM protein [Alphaproteobacteria bacterium]